MKTETLVLVIGAGLILAGGGKVAYDTYKQRGIRNNNPGNLIITNIPWKGKVTREKNTDGKFEQFTSPEFGIRAMFMDIRGDIKRGLNTIRKLITTYAPPSENNTAAYIAAVSKSIGKAPDATISEADYPQLVAAIIKHENGVQPYPMETINSAIRMA